MSNFTIDEIVERFPKMSFLKSPVFETLPADKKEFLLQCVEDALFWVDLEKKPESSDGFKFLAASFGLHQAEEEAQAKGLEGKDREKFLRESQELYTIYNPFGQHRDSDTTPS